MVIAQQIYKAISKKKKIYFYCSRFVGNSLQQ